MNATPDFMPMPVAFCPSCSTISTKDSRSCPECGTLTVPKVRLGADLVAPGHPSLKKYTKAGVI
jgi:hypothetical protein